MYLTPSNQMKGLTKTKYEALCEICRYAKNLYNVGVYSIRQYFFPESQYWRYESHYHAGNLLNADTNGSANILRKSNHRLDVE